MKRIDYSHLKENLALEFPGVTLVVEIGEFEGKPCTRLKITTKGANIGDKENWLLSQDKPKGHTIVTQNCNLKVVYERSLATPWDKQDKE